MLGVGVRLLWSRKLRGVGRVAISSTGGPRSAPKSTKATPVTVESHAVADPLALPEVSLSPTAKEVLRSS